MPFPPSVVSKRLGSDPTFFYPAPKLHSKRTDGNSFESVRTKRLRFVSDVRGVCYLVWILVMARGTNCYPMES